MSETVAKDPKTRSIEDAGRKIGGARKDWRERTMSVEDIATMTAAEVGATVMKDHVWPAPDYAALVEGGMEPLAAALIKGIRDGIAKQPRQSKRDDLVPAATAYVEYLGFLSRAYAACATVSDVRGVCRHAETFAAARGTAPGDRTMIFSIYKGRFSPLSVDGSDFRRAENLVGTGFPGDVPAWRRGVEIRQSGDRVVLRKGNARLGEYFESNEAALAWLEADYGSRKTVVADGPKSPPKYGRPHLDCIRRDGPDRRGGMDVTSDMFVEHFGFHGTEFGNWLPDDERQMVLNAGWDALEDMAEFLDVSPKAISLGGRLSVAFGARGQSGVAAHYEPGRTVINLTRMNGAGSLAHEYFHALDHAIGSEGGLSEMEGTTPRSASGWYDFRRDAAAKRLPNVAGPITDDIDEWMKAIKFSPLSKEEYLSSENACLDKSKIILPKWERILAEFVQEYPNPKADNRVERERRKELQDYVNGLKVTIQARTDKILIAEANLEYANFGSRKSDFMSEAEELCGKTGDYWKRPTELFARSGECAVNDWLAEKGRRTQYLVHSVESGLYAKPVYKADPYPGGEERVRICAAIRDLARSAALLFDAAPVLKERSEEDERMETAGMRM